MKPIKLKKPIRLYKWTDCRDRTRNNTQWGRGIRHSTNGMQPGLCTDSWLHAYEHPALAACIAVSMYLAILPSFGFAGARVSCYGTGT